MWNVPARFTGFVGGTDLLTTIHESFPSPVALYGMGGVGKTSAAAEYAHRHAADYDIVWWVPSEVAAAIPDRLSALAVAMGLVDTDESTEVAVSRRGIHTNHTTTSARRSA